jgi:predicted lipoprotein with Yx(FWY)xxD motif
VGVHGQAEAASYVGRACADWDAPHKPVGTGRVSPSNNGYLKGLDMHMDISRRGWQALIVAVLVVASACGSAATSGTGPAGSVLVATARNAALGTTVLVDARGHTLYSLSAERNGRFICTKHSTVPGGTGSCLSLWRPLIAHGAVAARGVGSLGVVNRPDGAGRQVTYRGLPLYTFVEDHAAGDASGNGFRDVGVWRAATAGSTPAAPATTSSGSGRYGY